MKFMMPSANLQRSSKTLLYAKRNPFQRSDDDFHRASADSNKPLPSKSALFSSAASRGRRRDIRSSEGIPPSSMKGADEMAIRYVSSVGGILSMLITRDLWQAASTFLILYIGASQNNKVGSWIRSIGMKLDGLSKGLTKKKMMKSIVDFLKAVTEASVLSETPSKLKSTIRNIEINDDLKKSDFYMNDDLFADKVDTKRSYSDAEIEIDVESETNTLINTSKTDKKAVNQNGIFSPAYFEDLSDNENSDQKPLPSATSISGIIPNKKVQVPTESPIVSNEVVMATIEVIILCNNILKSIL